MGQFTFSHFLGFCTFCRFWAFWGIFCIFGVLVGVGGVLGVLLSYKITRRIKGSGKKKMTFLVVFYY